MSEIEYRARILTENDRALTRWIDIGDIVIAIDLLRGYGDGVQIQRRECAPWADWTDDR